MTNHAYDDIMIVRYNDIILNRRRVVLLSDRTKQVQFRMPEELHTELKAALVYDKSSFADLFNKAAEDYLAKRKRNNSNEEKRKNGGKKNA